ncbi:DUF58 domain-containing protein [Oscillospiraceae bacterium HV4-5-C5C]|nr:DUF58 domain-containing protein [Oscillospiraceae bacterium HV4-5-C5C]
MIYLAVLLLIAVFIGVQDRIFRQAGLRSVHYRCYPGKEELFEGETLDLIEEVSNQRRLPLPWLKSELVVSPSLSFAQSTSVTTDRLKLVKGVFVLHGWQSVRRSWHVTCDHFGRPGVYKALLLSSDLLGFVTLSDAVMIDRFITVLPRPLLQADFPFQYQSLYGDMAVRRRYVPDPFWPNGIKAYEGRESLRDIHWYATALSGQMMVSQYADSSQQSVTIVLNLEQHTLLDWFSHNDTDFSLAVRLAATFLDQNLAAGGLPVQLAVNGRLQKSAPIYRPKRGASPNPGSGRAGLLTPVWSGKDNRSKQAEADYILSRSGQGQEHVRDLLRILACLDTEASLPLPQFMEALAPQLVATDVILLSPYLDEQAAAVCRRWHSQGQHIRLALLALPQPEAQDKLQTWIDQGVIELLPLYQLSRQMAEDKAAAAKATAAEGGTAR